MTTETVWLKAADLLSHFGWTAGVAEVGGCMCAGGAIAKAITGDAHSMYDDRVNETIWRAMETFADHVGAPTRDSTEAARLWWDLDTPCERVFVWNDNYATKEDVLKALVELHEAEVASTT